MNGNEAFRFLRILQDIVWNLTEDSISEAVQLIESLLDINFPYSFNHIICQLIYSTIIATKKEFDIYFHFLKALEIIEEAKTGQNIICAFAHYIQSSNSQESKFLLEKMIEQNLIDTNIIKNICLKV